MAEFPALPLFTDALLADAGYLTDAEMGRYIRLLVLCWRSPDCKIPNDDAWLARRLGRAEADVKEQFRPLLTEFFSTDGNWMFQKRLRKEFLHARKYAKRQSERAKSRWNNDKDASRGNADAAMHPTLPYPTQEYKTDKPIPTAANGSGHFEKNGGGGWRFEPTDDTLERLREVAPRWDRQALVEKYRGFAKGREQPRSPQAAFLGWAAKFTKGQPPP